MNSRDLISILMPVKNTDQFLEECLDAIVLQSENNWELIAVDDQSTDKSYSILKKFASSDKRIKIFKNNGIGIIDALRLAYSKSRGKLITRMDSDDIMSIDKLSVLKSNLINSGKGHLALGLVKYFSEKPLGEGFKNYEYWLNDLTFNGINFSGIYKECVIPSPCWMIFREDLDKCNAFIPDVYPEDYDLAFRFYLNKIRPIACNKIVHYWRDYSTRTSRTHIHYADNTFLDIKTHYFLKLDYDKTKNLVVWGAGTKGKTLAKKLLKKGIEFFWICDNPKKIGKHIYEQEMLPFSVLKQIENAQSIVTVANRKAQLEIKIYFKELGQKPLKDYFFFC